MAREKTLAAYISR